MKKALNIITVLLFAVASVTFLSSAIAPAADSVLVGTYNGISDDGEFSFTDAKGKTVLFQEVDDAVEFDFYDENAAGTKLTVTWRTEQRDVVTDEDEPTGEKVDVKVIVKVVVSK